MTDNRIKTENLCVGYNKEIILKDIALEVKAGNIVTLIGPNGSGKTTLLKAISKYLTAQSGEIYIDDKLLEEIKGEELAKKISVVWTKRPNAELMTVYDMVAMGRYPYTSTMGILGNSDIAAIQEAMELTNITAIQHKYFDEISDGQRQRVLLAKAICQSAQVLILDEPTSFLDIHYKLEFFGILKRLVKEKNIAVLMSLHEIEFAKKISDYVVCIKDKEVYRSGKAEVILSKALLKELFDIKGTENDDYFEKIVCF